MAEKLGTRVERLENLVGVLAEKEAALQGLADGNPAARGEVGDLHHGERLQVHGGKTLLEAAEHLAEPVQGQCRVQSADDVELGDGLAPAFAGALPDLFQRHGVRLGVAHPLAERAQAATGHADIGRIDVPVDVKVGFRTVQAFAHQVGQVAERQDIGGAVERHAVLERQALPRFHLAANRVKPGTFKYNYHVVQV